MIQVILSPTKVPKHIKLMLVIFIYSLLPLMFFGPEEAKPFLRMTPTDSLASLNDSRTRYFIYDDEVISQSRLLQKLRSSDPLMKSKDTADLDHVRTDVRAERNILEALKRHPLRTIDPNAAELFVVPIPIAELFAYGCKWEDCTWYDEAFHALFKKNLFQKHMGRNHILISLSWPAFNKRYSAFFPALSRSYKFLENVTVAHNYDPFGALELMASSEKGAESKGFEHLYPMETPVTNAFSLGLGFDAPFAARVPSYSHFQAARRFIFYHSRNTTEEKPGFGFRMTYKTFGFGSTRYRDALLREDVAIGALPLSSIGDEIPRSEWETEILDSKFCLVIRGDTPHSHSLLFAVRAGCIPVVVSNHYQTYAGPFKASLLMSDFCIFIEENLFLENPVQELLKLQDLSEDDIKAKLAHLAIAQSILIPERPGSLFVPAFLRQAIWAQTNLFSSKIKVAMSQDRAIVSGREFMYRYPSTLSHPDPSWLHDGDNPIMIVGVLSSNANFNARHSIRETWADGRLGRVFFVVAGTWNDTEAEFMEYGDMFWIDMEEDYFKIVYKTLVFLQAVERHVLSYDYVLKTDDDSYVVVDDVKRLVVEAGANFWGWCNSEATPFRDPAEKFYISESDWPRNKYPPYAQGLGYVLSRKFNKCIESKMVTGKILELFEDVNTGILAEECGFECVRWDRFWEDPYSTVNTFTVHHIKNSSSMVYTHWEAMERRKMGEWAVPACRGETYTGEDPKEKWCDCCFIEIDRKSLRKGARVEYWRSKEHGWSGATITEDPKKTWDGRYLNIKALFEDGMNTEIRFSTQWETRFRLLPTTR